MTTKFNATGQSQTGPYTKPIRRGGSETRPSNP